VRTSE
jgi:hypothetical protein